MFRRKGADLVIEKNLTLVESLCGFDFSITHMDKRSLRVKSNPGQVSYYRAVSYANGDDDRAHLFGFEGGGTERGRQGVLNVEPMYMSRSFFLGVGLFRDVCVSLL